MAVGLSIGSNAQSDSHVCPRSSGLRLAPCCGRQAKDCDQQAKEEERTKREGIVQPSVRHL